MFHAKIQTPLERLAPIFAKGQLDETDVDKHFELLASLQIIWNSALRSKTHKDFNKVDLIRATVEAKLACYKVRFWEEESERRRLTNSSSIRFESIINFIAKKAELASLMGSVKIQTGKVKPAVRVNATEVETTTSQPWNEVVETSPKKEQGSLPIKDTCAECHTGHKTKECFKLLKIAEDKIIEKLRSLKICFKCCKHGHMAKACREKPICAVCGNAHITLLHNFLVKKNAAKHNQALKMMEEKAKARAAMTSVGIPQESAAPPTIPPLIPGAQQGKRDTQK